MYTGARRVENDYIRTSMFLDECICKNILHVSCKEVAVGDSVVVCIDLCIFNSLRNIFYTYDF